MVTSRPSTFGYGSFSGICTQTGLAICNLFPPVPQPSCSLKRVGDVSNLGNILVSCGALCVLVLILIRMSRKLAAVGRKEMMALYIALALYLCLQIFTTSSVFSPDSVHLVRITSFQLAWSFSIFYMLLFNGLVGFQYWRDGSRLSLMLLLGVSLGLTAGLTAFNINRAEAYLMSPSNKSSFNLKDPLLYTLYIVWPMIASLIFLALQFLLVLRSLSARLPLVYLSMALALLVGSQLVYFYGSSSICLASNHSVDAAIFHSIFITLASLALFKFWSDITEDDWDDFKLTA